MSSYKNCHCGSIVVAYVLSTQFVAACPDTWKYCKVHFRESRGLPPVTITKRASHPAYATFGREEPSCYGNGGMCTNDGTLYPGGTYCEEHKPDGKQKG